VEKGMRNQKEDIFSVYKPLRNHLRKCSISDSLRLVREYSQNLQFRNSDFSPDIEVAKEYLDKDIVQKIRWLSECKLEILAKEIILNSSETITGEKTLRKWNYLVGAVNKIHDLEGEISKNYFDVSNVKRELFRMAHTQFPWQIESPNTGLLARYYKIYSYPKLDAILKNTIGLSTKEFYFIGMIVASPFFQNIALSYPPRIEIEGVIQESIDKFLKHFSLDLKSLKSKLRSEQNMNENYFHAFSSLRGYPLIKMDYNGKDSLVCPIPTLLFWRMTNGLYYEVVDKENFDKAFGEAFQKHIGECIKASCKNPKIKFYPEESFIDGKKRKDTIDWLIEDKDCIIFVECKGKRLTMPSKTELLVGDKFEEDLDKMADFVVQTYKTIRDYTENKYPEYKYQKEKTVCPFVITLEDWHLFDEKILLREKIKEKMLKANIPVKWLNEIPYTICSAQEFEELIQIIQKLRILSTLQKKSTDPEKSKWALTTFLSSEFPEEYKKIKSFFLEEFDEIYPKKLRTK
jgi:hypothetical protein